MDDKQEPAAAADRKGKDTTEYSASKAPETRGEAEEKRSFSDWRLIPGGRRGAAADIGITAVDRSGVPGAARDTGQTRYGETSKGK
jgi:hypothetical protein